MSSGSWPPLAASPQVVDAWLHEARPVWPPSAALFVEEHALSSAAPQCGATSAPAVCTAATRSAAKDLSISVEALSQIYQRVTTLPPPSATSDIERLRNEWEVLQFFQAGQ